MPWVMNSLTNSQGHITLCLHTGTVEGRSMALLGQIYGFQVKVPPWEERLNAAIYRGSCYATANSSDEASPEYQPRAQLARWGGGNKGQGRHTIKADWSPGCLPRT